MVWNYNFSGMLCNLFLLENSCFDTMSLWQCWTMANVIFYTFSKGFSMIDVLTPIHGSFSISYHHEMSLGLNVCHWLTIAPSIYTYSTYCNMVNTHIMHIVSYKYNKDHLRWNSSMYGLTLIINCQMVVLVHRREYIEILVTKVRKIVNKNFWKVFLKNCIWKWFCALFCIHIDNSIILLHNDYTQLIFSQKNIVIFFSDMSCFRETSTYRWNSPKFV